MLNVSMLFAGGVFEDAIRRLWYLEREFILAYGHVAGGHIVTCANIMECSRAVRDDMKMVSTGSGVELLVTVRLDMAVTLQRTLYLPVDEITVLVSAVVALGFPAYYYFYNQYVGEYEVSDVMVVALVGRRPILCSLSGDNLCLFDFERRFCTISVPLADSRAFESLQSSLLEYRSGDDVAAAR